MFVGGATKRGQHEGHSATAATLFILVAIIKLARQLLKPQPTSERRKSNVTIYIKQVVYQSSEAEENIFYTNSGWLQVKRKLIKIEVENYFIDLGN